MRPRRFQHRGSIDVVALLVDDLLDAERARARVLSLWEPGASIHRAAGGLLLRFPCARRMDVERAGAIPFVALRGGKAFASAPLTTDEFEAFVDGSWVLVRGGEARALSLEAQPIDPSTWIDVEDWSVVELEPLGDPPTAAHFAVPEPKPTREVFEGIVGAPPVERAAILAALRQEPTAPRPVGRFAVFAARLLAMIAAAATRGRAQSAGHGQTAGGARDGARGLAVRPSAPRGPSALDWIIARLQTLVARLLLTTRLAQLVGRRQAAYVENLFELFERGELDQALRRAIPLDGQSRGDAVPALGVPNPRADLAIHLERQAAGGTLGVGEDLFDALRRTYRAALQRLEDEGRIDEAAFVLAELLQQDEEAVAFLERHDRYRLAADIADARNLPPDLRVRQRFLAGDRAHAIALARAHGAFGGAIQRLERSNLHEAATALRLEWADLLAAGGDYPAAVSAIWPVQPARAVALRWIDLGIELGGVVGARMLAHKVALTPEPADDLLDRIQQLTTASDGASERRAFARALLQQERTPLVRVVARAALRALYADVERNDDGTLRPLIRDVLELTDDAALRADQPTWPPVAPMSRSTRRDVARFDAGSVSISDAALLPDGRTLIALGESGVRLLSRAGRVVAQFDQPADRLVISDRGDRAIAVAKRGQVSRLARIDVCGRRSEPWCEAPLGAFARDFDGTSWVAGEVLDGGGRAVLVDVFAARLTALRELGSTEPIAIARSERSCAILAAEIFAPVERSLFALPSYQLQARGVLPSAPRPGVRWAASPGGAFAALLMPMAEEGRVALHANRTPEGGLPLGALGEQPCDLAIDETYVSCALVSMNGLRVLVLARESLSVTQELFLEGAMRGGVRAQEGMIVVWDDLGRVIAFDPANGRMVRDLRV